MIVFVILQLFLTVWVLVDPGESHHDAGPQPGDDPGGECNFAASERARFDGGARRVFEGKQECQFSANEHLPT